MLSFATQPTILPCSTFARIPAGPRFDPSFISTVSYGNLLEAGFEQAFVRRDWRPPREAIEAERKRRVWWAG